MSFQTFAGIETEYGIAVPDDPSASPVVSSARVVNAYRSVDRQWAGFDYSDEEPLQDARQPRLARDSSRFALDDFGIPNLVLTNGARVYVDHAHPEYSSPECASAYDLLRYEHAGDEIMRRAAVHASSQYPGAAILLYKNNIDGKGAAYGTHENYLIPRSVPFGALTQVLMPFFVTRSVFVGAGRTGSEHQPDVAFQLTQRAEFFECEVGLETTVRRGIMNTRDEPHADPSRYRRLHVINGDANMCEVAGFLKVGTMMLVLDAYIAGYLTDLPVLLDPVQAFHHQSHDLTLNFAHMLESGKTATALGIQTIYRDACAAYIAAERSPDSEASRVLTLWSRILDDAANNPQRLVGRVDWATKQNLITAYMARNNCAATDARVQLIDLQYHDLRHEHGLYYRLRQHGRVERILTDEAIETAITTAPTNTRAYFRGESIRHFSQAIIAAGWDAMVFSNGNSGHTRVTMPDPQFGTAAHTADLFAAHDTVDAFLADLLSSPERTAISLG
ncbi:MAG: depupylase/deamidase Dop [Nitriliruptoraceae bacterium]